MFQHILVATDLTEASSLAVDTALALGRRLAARVSLLHVIEPPYNARTWFAPSATDAQFLQTLVARERDASRRLMEDQVRSASADATAVALAETLVREGIPADVILAAVAELGADLLVVGTHGRRGLQHVLLGSVAERLVRTASCPVLTVRVPR